VFLVWLLVGEDYNMTKEEALKLALEALENAIAVRHGKDGTKFVNPLEPNAITAIKAALAQPAQEPNKISTEELIYMTGVYDGKVLEREACADLCYQLVDNSRETRFATAIRARGNT
jgi:hypothetical protein